jgi:CHAT domain-containing protein/Tfp pilus assembly protein PilF
MPDTKPLAGRDLSFRKVRPKKEREKMIILAVMLVKFLVAAVLNADDWRTHSGVVFNQLASESPLAKAGLEPGDVIVAWRRLSTPPANPEETHGEIRSVFDWTWMVMEQAPRGPVELVGVREGKKNTFVVARGPWSADEWPSMPKESLDAFVQNQNAYLNRSKENEVERWWEQTTAQQQDWHLRSWLWARLGKMRAARGYWTEAYDAYYSAIADANEPFAESVLWWELGQLYQRHNELDLAHQAYVTAQVLREIAGGKESLAVAAALNDLGALAWERGELEQADDLLQQVLRIRQCLAPGSLWVAQTLNNLGLVASDRRRLDRASDFLQRSSQLLEELLPNSLALANSLNNLGMLAGNRRDYDQAYQFLQRAMEIKQKLAPNSLDFAQGLHNLATVAGERGDLGKAADLFQRALEIRQKLAPASRDAADTLVSLGNLYLARGDLDLAMDYERRSMEIRQKLAPDSLQVAETLFSMGLVEESRGEQLRARDLHEQALKLRQRLAPGSLDLASSLNSLAVLAEKRGDLKQATQLHQHALDLRQKLAPDKLEVANSLNNLGHTAMRAGQLARAEELHRRALEIQSRRAPEGLDSALSLSYLGDIAGQRGDWGQAITLYQHALKIQQELAPGTADTAKALHDLGAAHRMSNPRSLEIVDDFFRRALDTLELQLSRFGGTQDMRARFRAEYSNFYRDAIGVQLKLGQPAAAFYTLERSRARSFLDQLAERDIIFTTDISEDLDRERRLIAFRTDRKQQELSGLNERDHPKQIEELRGQLRHLGDEANDLAERIRRTSPKLAALQYPQPLDLESARASLDAGTLLLSYSVGEKETLLFSFSKDQDLRVDTLTIGEQELRDQIRYLLGGVASKGRPGLQRNHNFEALAQRLDSILITPVADRVAKAERLLIIPGGPLHLLPWGSLIRKLPFSTENRGRKWQYLIEWKPLSTTLSATVFAERKKYRRQQNRVASSSLVAFGDPLLPQLGVGKSANQSQDPRVRSAGERGFNYEPLPAARNEVRQIASIFPQAAIYLGPNATEERVKALPRDTQIVHFATHATLDERFPLNSAVVLSIPEKFEEGKENGLLQAWEIFEQVRLDADLVVLSACESGLGKEMGGEGLIGLTRAFQYAGARSVMASLWKISDRTTAELMVRFYKHLKDGLPKDEALRAAQMELIRGPIQVKNEKGEVEEIDASAPYYWAAFQIYGDWQ